jgi:hypothetical protein
MVGGRVGWFGACEVGGNHVSIVLIANRHTSYGCSVRNDLVKAKLRVSIGGDEEQKVEGVLSCGGLA